jgi:hypothetical protein
MKRFSKRCEWDFAKAWTRHSSDLPVLFVVDFRKQEWDFSIESRKARRRDETFERVDTIAHLFQVSRLP